MSLELLDDGQVRITFEDGTRLFRRPKVGEYRDLRVSSTQLFDELPDDTNGREQAIEERLFEWWAKAGETLADTSLPADRDVWPLWLGNVQAVTETIKHWRAVPLARGAKA